MLFGQEPSPKIYSWGNPNSSIDNRTLGAGRVTESGTFARAYVPMHDASTTDPVVQSYRIDDLNRKSSFYFKSLDFLMLLNQEKIQTVLAIDEAGKMWTWGKDATESVSGNISDATGLGGPVIGASFASEPVRSSIHTPHRVVTPEERETGVTHTWAKVQCGIRTSMALTAQGKLYASGVEIGNCWMDGDTPATFPIRSTCFQSVSTQTWNDFCMDDNERIHAVRDDGKLFHRGFKFDFSGPVVRRVPAEPYEGMVAEAYMSGGRFYLGTTGYTARFSYGFLGEQKITVSPVFNTTTGELRPFTRAGFGYTAAPTVSMTITRHTAVPAISPPAIATELVPDDKWVGVSCNRSGDVLAVNQKTVFLKARDVSYRQFAVPDGDFINTSTPEELAYGGFFNLYRPLSNSLDTVDCLDLELPATSATASYVSVTAICARQVLSTAHNFAIRFENPLTGPGEGKTNLLVWGANRHGLLATGSTSPQLEMTVAGSGKPGSGEWVFESFSMSSIHSAGVKTDWPEQESRDLVIAGRHQFAGNSAATSDHVSFSYPTPASANSFQNDPSAPDKDIRWRKVFCCSAGNEQLTIASRG